MGKAAAAVEYPVVKTENIPQKLKNLKAWVLWGQKKIPLRVDERPASSTTASDWSDFETAEAAYGCSAKALGLGFVFTKDWGIVGIDLDDCFEAGGRDLKEWAAKVVSQFSAGYIERSPGGMGLHILIEGRKPGTECKHVVTTKAGERLGEIEIYDSARYFTVTGAVLDRDFSDIAPQQEALDTIYRGVFGTKERAAGEPPIESSSGVDGEIQSKPLGADSIRRIILDSAQAPKFLALTTGSLESACAPYGGDHSRAAYALTSIIAWYTDSWEVADAIFRDSPLYAGKWLPNSEVRGGRARQGKWAAVGPQQFKKQRLYHLARGEVYSGAGEQPSCQFDAAEHGGVDDKGNGKGEADYERHLDLLLERGEVARDLLTGALRIRDGGEWEPVFCKSLIGSLRAECDVRGKPYKKSRLEDYLYRYEQALERRLLIDLPEWDGRDRIADLCACLNVSNVSAQAAEDLVKDWCAKLWGKIWQPERVQNRCVILQGRQGIGKDYWVKSLLCGLGTYLADFTLTSKQNRESELAVTMGSHLALFISEFDKTAELGTATLKELITKESFTCVRKYDRDASRLLNRCSVIGACNPQDIFRDVTGNRRFLLLQLDGGVGEAIRWDFPLINSEFSLQILAQSKALWDSGFKASNAAEAEMAASQAESTPESEESEIVAEFEDSIRRKAKSDIGNNHGLYRLPEIDELVATIGRNYSIPRRRVLGILKTAGCQKRAATCRWYGLRSAISSGVEPEEESAAGGWESEFN